MTELRLPTLEVNQIRESKGQFDYYVTLRDVALRVCCATPYLVKNGHRVTVFRDLPIHGKLIGLHFKRQRYHCQSCYRTVYDTSADFDDTHRMTNRMADYIRTQAYRRTFVSLAEELGLDERTIRTVFSTHVKLKTGELNFETPVVLGIDEAHLFQQTRLVLTNVKERTIIDMVKSRTQQSVINYLMEIKDKNKIEIVTIDMWRPYRTAVREVIPNSVIVIDKFHVVRMANKQMELVRKTFRKDLPEKERRTLKGDRFIFLKRRSQLVPQEEVLLDQWFGLYPILKNAYTTKERFFEICDLDDRKQAEEEYQQWVKTMPSHLEPTFGQIVKTISNWHEEIFSHFDYRYTNAFTECANGLIKTMNRMGRGYSFDILRAKILLSYGFHKVQKYKYQKFSEPNLKKGEIGYFGMVAEESQKDVNYGVSIDKLLQNQP